MLSPPAMNLTGWSKSIRSLTNSPGSNGLALRSAACFAFSGVSGSPLRYLTNS